MCIRFTATGDSTAHGGGRDLSTTDAPTPCDRLAALLLAPRSLQHPPYTRPAVWLLSLAPVSSQLSEFSSLSSSPPDPSSSPLSPPSSLPAPPSSPLSPPSSPPAPSSSPAPSNADLVAHPSIIYMDCLLKRRQGCSYRRQARQSGIIVGFTTL